MTTAQLNQEQANAAPVVKSDVQSESGVASEKRRRILVPDYRVFLRDNAHELQVFMPGVATEDLSLELEGRFLKVRGVVSEPAWEGFQPSYAEFAYGDYRADFKIPEGVDRNNVSGTLKNGVLAIQLPKADEVLPKTIQVNVH